jgi:hypothetical protein
VKEVTPRELPKLANVVSTDVPSFNRPVRSHRLAAIGRSAVR